MKLQVAQDFRASIIAAGEFKPENIDNMDQTPSPLILISCNSGKTYVDKGSKTVWCRSVGGSGLEMWYVTVQPTIFGDGVS